MQSELSGTSTKIAQSLSKLNDFSLNKNIHVLTLSETVWDFMLTLSDLTLSG